MGQNKVNNYLIYGETESPKSCSTTLKLSLLIIQATKKLKSMVVLHWFEHRIVSG